MLKILLLFIILIASMIIGPLLAGHQGYVLIQTTHYNIETSVSTMVVMLIVLLLVLSMVQRIFQRLWHTGLRTHGWITGCKRTRARQQTHAGLVKLTEGDYQQVEKLLIRHADHAEQPVVNYLLAAEAAQQRGDILRVNQYLERATEVAGNHLLPVDITRARIQLAQGENHAARHSIDALLNYAPRHPEVLRLAAQAYLRTQAYEPVLEILPALSKTNLYTDAEIVQFQQQAYIGLMDQKMASGGSEGLKCWWREQSRKTRREVTLQVAMVEHLIECNDRNTAQKIIVEALKYHFDPRLVLLIPKIKSGHPQPLEKLLNQQIKRQGDTPHIRSALGQLWMHHGEWLAASEAFRAALKQRPDAHDYAWLADALDKLHCPEEAAQMRHDGLLLTLNQVPSSPTSN